MDNGARIDYSQGPVYAWVCWVLGLVYYRGRAEEWEEAKQESLNNESAQISRETGPMRILITGGFNVDLDEWAERIAEKIKEKL